MSEELNAKAKKKAAKMQAKAQNEEYVPQGTEI